jgi:hypothetical protein
MIPLAADSMAPPYWCIVCSLMSIWAWRKSEIRSTKPACRQAGFEIRYSDFLAF